MGRKARISKGKLMKPNFFVFCEGETEVVYVKFLRSIYRKPIQIIPKKSDSNISDKYIANCKKEYVETKNDKTFLMFDLDVEGMLGRLQRIEDAVLLVSNPCIELWFLLHYEDCRMELSTGGCLQRLKSHSVNYAKGMLSDFEKARLAVAEEAVKRAKKMTPYQNPSTTVYLLIEALSEK